MKTIDDILFPVAQPAKLFISPGKKLGAYKACELLFHFFNLCLLNSILCGITSVALLSIEVLTPEKPSAGSRAGSGACIFTKPFLFP